MQTCLRLLDNVSSDLRGERSKRKRKASVIPSSGECNPWLSIQMFRKLCCGGRHLCRVATVQMTAEFGTRGRALHMQVIVRKPRRNAARMQIMVCGCGLLTISPRQKDYDFMFVCGWGFSPTQGNVLPATPGLGGVPVANLGTGLLGQSHASALPSWVVWTHPAAWCGQQEVWAEWRISEGRLGCCGARAQATAHDVKGQR